jgi:hypothetical protein
MFNSNSASINNIDDFKKCDNGTTELGFNEIWKRLCEPPIKNYPDATGFGRFLRRLYDACEA